MLPADLILTNGNLITIDERQPRAAGMAVCGERIVYVGDDRGAMAFGGPQTRVIDLGGRTMVPGFIDAHLHLFAFGLQSLREADLTGAGSISEVMERLAAKAKNAREGWILGYGFDQDKLAERRFPTRGDLDRISATRPVMISRICGHAVVVNSAALGLVSATDRATGDEASGLYTEGAGGFERHVPPPDEAEAEEAVLLACRTALQTGITSAQTLLDTPDQMAAYARLRRRGRLPIRVTGMPPYAAVAELREHGVNTTFGDEWLRFGAAKLFSDGSLGARTAWLSSPYADDPRTRGVRIYEPEVLKAHARDAQRKGFQLAIHAIGDQALRESLDAIEAALDGGEEDNGYHRHRIEHASLTPPDCLERMAARRVVVTAQPQFVPSDSWTPQRIGPERRAWAYPFRSMVEAGIPVALSSDCPVERLDAFACLSAAVNRDEWTKEECLSVEQALRCYCLGGAYAGHAEERLGTLAAGKLADFVVLSGNPTRVASGELAGLKAEGVFVGGKEQVRGQAEGVTR